VRRPDNVLVTGRIEVAQHMAGIRTLKPPRPQEGPGPKVRVGHKTVGLAVRIALLFSGLFSGNFRLPPSPPKSIRRSPSTSRPRDFAKSTRRSWDQIRSPYRLEHSGASVAVAADDRHVENIWQLRPRCGPACRRHRRAKLVSCHDNSGDERCFVNHVINVAESAA
jgi:hypothetical protein